MKSSSGSVSRCGLTARSAISRRFAAIGKLAEDFFEDIVEAALLERARIHPPAGTLPDACVCR
jgi:hypothetical protein